ncbi:hypothetical protein A2U01_0068535, partial [Trifolium medium]|nr:hypothetical protein [Trifolium medium]
SGDLGSSFLDSSVLRGSLVTSSSEESASSMLGSYVFRYSAQSESVLSESEDTTSCLNFNFF